ncbi:MAG TPA: type I-U CRISPR-associated helicase/endonuclease Cas3 [Tepidisphaeraceae bacterium]|jgi:CRISPR-associated endonuclease/helicase Cas3|nr:type I-U CRISPR-associated helicase/endonuclease Cas3 [Tepidisphaeraceae bacterium]
MPEETQKFEAVFKALTGNEPLSWQKRLYCEFQKGSQNLPGVIDLPTGLGKTMVMAIWLIARAFHRDKIPTRLIYVVDRRTVVDQATDLAEALACNWKKTKIFAGDPPAISTLRGQLADNRGWSRDPSRPAIIIGTVDLIGSALLFSGYRSGFKTKPLHAGLLGQDSLLVLDEAHLSKPFAKLITSIYGFQKTHGKPMRVIRMSATSGGVSDERPAFTLEFDENGNLAGNDAKDSIINGRFNAKKKLSIAPDVDPMKFHDTIADAAITLANNAELKGKRIVVFVRKPDDATKIAEAIRKRQSTKSRPGPYVNSVEVLTGTMRGLERDELLAKPVLKRFLDGAENPNLDANQHPVFLISTSAGEVGFDLNGDHLVGDAATIDSWIQRLGRVNRRGNGDAVVILIRQKEPADKTDFEKACIKATELLAKIEDVSPKALAAFKKSLAPEELKAASTPEPTMVDLTDILLDAWSMTSITERMPGRPDVAPWLRGVDDEQAQTTIAWRAEIELLQHDPDPRKAFQFIFAKHRIRPHESLTVNTGRLLEFLKQIPKLKGRPDDLIKTRIAVRLPRGEIECRSLERLAVDPSILYAESTLILPATFGGLNGAGMLDADSIPKVRKPDDRLLEPLDLADHPDYEQTEGARHRLRILIERHDGSWKPHPLPNGVPIPSDLHFMPHYANTSQLFKVLTDATFRIRLVQPIRFNEEGDSVQSMVCLSPTPDKKKPVNQPLVDHVRAVEIEAGRIASALGLSGAILDALVFAAKWHDEGKKAAVWQTFAYGSVEPGQWLGKMARTRDPRLLNHYRHELGSLLRVRFPDRCQPTIACRLPPDEAARGLALHLIAAHHGGARPHFPASIYRDFEAEQDELHTESIRRFAQLQKDYGWWRLAWLENLLRCADAIASAQAGSTGEEDETEDEA